MGGDASSTSKIKVDLRNLSSDAYWWESLFYRIPDDFKDLSFSTGKKNGYKNRLK